MKGAVAKPAWNEGRLRASWQRDELRIESYMRAGDREFQFRDFWSLSADGLTLKMEHRDDDLAGQVSILERVR